MKNLITGIFAFFLALGANGEVPSLINYQGKITGLPGSHNQPAPKKSGWFWVKVFDKKIGGNLVYEEDVGFVTIEHNGVYSFGFGEKGHSILNFEESLTVQEEGEQIFDFTLSKVPVPESLKLKAASYSWDEKNGSSDLNNLLVQFNRNNRSVKIVFLNGSPDKDAKFEFSYRTKEKGIISALSSSQNSWLELAFKFNNPIPPNQEPTRTFSPRERLISVPYAIEAKRLSLYPSFGKLVGIPLNKNFFVEHDGFIIANGSGGSSIEITHPEGGYSMKLNPNRGGGDMFGKSLPVRKNSTVKVSVPGYPQSTSASGHAFFMPIIIPK